MSSFLKKKKLSLIDSVLNNDVDLVASLLDSPEMYKVTDRRGNNLLQLAIMEKNNFQVFDYLLSIDDFPLELTNRKGHTALETALDKPTYYDYDNTTDIREYFAEELINKGANIHRPMLLHCAIKADFESVLKYLIKNGANLNEKDRDGFTPLNLCFYYHNNPEIMLMLLCSGTDPFISDNDGYTPFDSALLPIDMFDDFNRPHLSTLMENLFYYTFDKHGKYKIPLDSYVFGRGSDSPFPAFDQIVGPEYINQVTIYCNKEGKYCLKDLLQLGRDNLRMFLQRYPEVLRELLLDYSVEDFFDRRCPFCLFDDDDPDDDDESIWECDCVWWKHINIEIFDMLIESELKSEAISFISGLDSTLLIENLYYDKISESAMTELICYLLSYGLRLHDIDLEIIYYNYRYCDLFKICLHMDLHQHEDYVVVDVMPRLISVVDADIQEYIKYPCTCSVKDLKLLMEHTAHPNLQEYCRKLENNELTHKLDKLPQVPLLVELARNTFRRHFIKKCNITSTKQFFTLLKRLPIGIIHRKILTFETKLYPCIDF